VAARDRAARETDDVDERAQPEPRRRIEPLEPGAREHAVLADERHDVGDRADRDDVEELHGARATAVTVEQRLDELERDADTLRAT
jgi:hypothetical protein